MNQEDNQYMEDDSEETVSKTQRKKEMLALQELGELLTTLPRSKLDKCKLPATLEHAIAEYKRIAHKRGAGKRQLQFIGRLMRDVDIEPIQQVLDVDSQQAELEKRRFHRLESLRDQLLAGDQGILEALITQCDELDIQYLRQLVRQATKEAQNGKPPTSARKLFTYLRDLPGIEPSN